MTRSQLAPLLIALTQTINAQPSTTRISGKVFTYQHLPASAIVVKVVQGDKEIARMITDNNGGYYFNLAPGNYLLEAGAVALRISVSISKSSVPDIILQTTPDQPGFSDEPTFTVAGVTDNTYRGGHGADTMLRSSETLAKATANLSKSSDHNSDPIHSQAELDEQSGHSLEAVKEFQKAAELNPSERNLFDWGTELLSHRAPQAASEVFSKASHLFPNSIRVILGLGTSWYALGSFEQARQCFFNAIDLDPTNPVPYAFLHESKSREIIDSPGYLQRFARYAEANPNNAMANYYHATALWNEVPTPENSDTIEKSIALLKKAITLDQHLASAYLALGVIYSTQHKYFDAINVLELSVQQNNSSQDNNSEAHYRLSEAYRLNGDRAKAAQELAIYKRLNEKNIRDLEQERRKLQQFVINLKNQ